MKIIAFIEEPSVIIEILCHIGEPHVPPVLTPASGPWGDIDRDQPEPELQTELDDASLGLWD